jgi:carboxyl-terminal processing protease
LNKVKGKYNHLKIMKKLLFLFIISLFIFSCRKKDDPDIEVTPAMGRDSLFYIMKEFYYWYDMPEAISITTSNKGNYKDPYELLEAMRYQALDRWSFVADYDEFIAEMQGTFVGHGFRIGIDDLENARIAMIYKNSPLYANGVRRGWIIKKINNTDPVPALLNGTYPDLIGPAQEGVTNIFLFQKPDGTDVTISSTKSTFTVNTVHVAEILQLSSGTTGHLVFDSFITPTSQELAAAFANFKTNNVKDLILDMRYNTGGYLNIAQTLASYIAGNSIKGSSFAKLQYNNKHQAENYTFPFVSTPYSLDLSRVVVISTRSTASASEAVMNGLKPFVNVVSIGDTTNGKPTGMNGWPIGKKYYMWPVTFKMVNAEDQGDYFDGISPAKVLPDDITHDFNDPEEVCLKEAIHYLETGSVSPKSVIHFKRYPQFSEKPSWMNNAFVTDK